MSEKGSQTGLPPVEDTCGKPNNIINM